MKALDIQDLLQLIHFFINFYASFIFRIEKVDNSVYFLVIKMTFFGESIGLCQLIIIILLNEFYDIVKRIHISSILKSLNFILFIILFIIKFLLIIVQFYQMNRVITVNLKLCAGSFHNLRITNQDFKHKTVITNVIIDIFTDTVCVNKHKRHAIV